MNGHEEDLQTGLDALAKLTEGDVYLSISTKTTSKSLREAKKMLLSLSLMDHTRQETLVCILTGLNR